MTAPAFTTREGLRALLRRFADPTDLACWDGPDGEALIRYCITRFAPLARKYRQPGDDGGAFAFEVMCDPHLLTADDPWAVVTTAVKRSFVASFTGDALLCGDRAARHAVDVHDPQRITDRDWTFLEIHLTATRDNDGQVPRLTRAGDIAPVELAGVVDDAVQVFRALGWPEESARFALEYISRRLELAGNPATAFEYLRRDKLARARLDLGQRAWTRVLTAVLGTADPDRSLVLSTRGLLLQILAGGSVDEVAADPALVRALRLSAPHQKAASHV